MKNSLVIAMCLAAAVCLFSLGVAPGFCADTPGLGADPDWLMTESKDFRIYYRDGVNLAAVERSLRRRTSYLGGAQSEDATVEERVGRRLDLLLGRAKDILGMHWNVPKLNIRIFNDRSELSDEYVKIFGTREEYKSFYVHKYETIYTSAEDISDSIVAHEMGHAIVDHYFAVVPPPKVSEVIASYVDMHLEN